MMFPGLNSRVHVSYPIECTGTPGKASNTAYCCLENRRAQTAASNGVNAADSLALRVPGPRQKQRFLPILRNCPDPAKAVPAGQRLLCGEVAEWSNAAVLKTVGLHGPGGSNPSLSAIGSPCATQNLADQASAMLAIVSVDLSVIADISETGRRYAVGSFCRLSLLPLFHSISGKTS